MDLHDIIVELGKRGIPFDQLLTIPEQDDWVYNTTTVNQQVLVLFFQCVEGGIFCPVSSSIQVTEFTIRDAHMLRILRITKHAYQVGATKRMTDFHFIRLYRMELPGYHTLEPYVNMNEYCPSLPLTYGRPSRS